MNQKHCEVILNNLSSLVEVLKYEIFSEKCLRKNIVSQKMLDNIERQFEKHQHLEELIRKITRRGPDAFAKLLDILLDETSVLLKVCSNMCDSL